MGPWSKPRSRAGSPNPIAGLTRKWSGASRTGIGATPVLGYIGCCGAIAKIDVTDRLHEIKCPALVIVGEQDQGTPPTMARQIHENLRGSELQIIPSAAHLSNIEQAQVFTEAVLGFIERVSRR